MKRLFATLAPICLLICAWPTSSIAAGLTLEEQLRQLGANYVKLKEFVETKDAQLESKVIELQTQVQKQNEIRTVLETKISLLETQMKQKDREYIILAEKIAQLERTRSGRSSGNLVVNDGAIARQLSGRSGIPRTCLEAHLIDPSLSSGKYWIDPDGQGVGDAPIYVYCDMTSGTTSVLHDSEGPRDVGHCAEPGCYSRAVNYNASSRQMAALVELSAECHQSIQYDCNFAPFEFDDVSYAWWNNKDGNSEYFWAGSDDSVHTCQCGIDGNCVDASLKCNCDSAAPIPLTDTGVITSKDILPISRLNFGRTQLQSSSGVHTLGPFECSGQTAIAGMPSSCEDLWRVGHSLSGLYSVIGNAMVESVYCDFTKLPNDAGFQKWIGFVDVKSSPTYFYVHLGQRYNQSFTPIPFPNEKLNIGEAMNLQSGKFTAPRTGIYSFIFSGHIRFQSHSYERAYCFLFKNGYNIQESIVDQTGPGWEYEPLILQSTLALELGDQIWVQLGDLGPGVTLYENTYTYFSGLLLEEDISISLNGI
ncbi:hypothetical protein OUZ56_006240 [Daphnia magna]|uniref:C1q domain-containing protein n=1 Tax=Daphnia magna TaxID=35525 RepID=A0ABQ9YV31_9CRUS|nr:hypothetical protein OUZ56_006240 [Daphnia magna]